MDKFVLSVYELNSYVSDKLYQDPFLEEIWISGEVGDLNIKHDIAWFVLSDGQASVDCMIFDFGASGFAEILEEGQAVLVNGDVSLYRKNGRFRIAVRQVQLTGLGEMYANFNLLKSKLEAKGVFAKEYKQKLPEYPKKIGVVTSREGAAIQDIIQIIRRRNPMVELVLYPVKVQGLDAPAEIVRGIEYLNERDDIDVLIVGRGGGAAEDLFAFNDERVVMEIFHSNIPVISAVGHESDFTLADMAADLRAPTPSAAAELAVPVRDDIVDKIRHLKKTMHGMVHSLLSYRKNGVWHQVKGLSSHHVQIKIERALAQVTECRKIMSDSVNKRKRELKLQYTTYKSILTGLDPSETFKRGFSVSSKNGKIVTSIHVLEEGDPVDIEFSDGVAKTTVKQREIH